MMKRSDGFTLVELVITIAIGSLITLAATTSLLLGLRIHAKNADTIVRQNTTNMLVQMLENIAETIPIADPEHGSEIMDISGKTYLNYQDNQLLVNGTVFMEGVTVFTADLDDNSILTVTIESNEKTYTAKIFCRLNDTTEGPDE